MVATRSCHPALKELDPQTAFLYTPRTVTFLLCGLNVTDLNEFKSVRCSDWGIVDFEWDIGGCSREWHSWNGSNNNCQECKERCLDCYLCVFGWGSEGHCVRLMAWLGYSIVQGPTTSMVRPHPTFWRLIHGICVVYFLFVVWILFQDLNTARQFMKVNRMLWWFLSSLAMQHLSEELGDELPERAYGEDCSLSLKNLRETVFDEFVLAHVIGWSLYLIHNFAEKHGY